MRRPPPERKIPGSNPACAGIFFGVDGSYLYGCTYHPRRRNVATSLVGLKQKEQEEQQSKTKKKPKNKKNQTNKKPNQNKQTNKQTPPPKKKQNKKTTTTTKNGHKGKNLTQNGEPQRYSLERRRRRFLHGHLTSPIILAFSSTCQSVFVVV